MMDGNRPQGGVVLRLGEFETTLATAQRSYMLDMGARRTADDWFAGRNVTPTPFELEKAVMAVEHEISRVALRGDITTPLVSDDAQLVDLARLAGVSGALPCCLGVDLIDYTFERLAKVAQGCSPTSCGLPDGEACRTFAARLLIVREVMHRLGFAQLVVNG